MEMKHEAEMLIEDIYKFKREKAHELSLMETILEYSHSKDIPIQEIGNILAEHDTFVEIFTKDLERTKFIKTTKSLDELNEMEW